MIFGLYIFEMKIKKFIISLLTFIIILSNIGCQNKTVDVDEIRYEEGIYRYKDWDSYPHVAVNDDDCVPDKETAANIGNAILECYQKQGYFKDYILQYIFYDTEDEIWILGFWEKDSKYPGGGYNMAISKKDAKVILKWGSE